jgi:hypothetical protein
MSSFVTFAFILGAALDEEHSRTVSGAQAEFDGLGKAVKKPTNRNKTPGARARLTMRS